MSRRARKRHAQSVRRATSRPAPARVDVAVPADADPNHHLWRNGRRWWIAFTVHQDHRQERIRLSLGTQDVVEARRRRDEMLALFASAEGCNVSLRFTPRGQRRGARAARPSTAAGSAGLVGEGA